MEHGDGILYVIHSIYLEGMKNLLYPFAFAITAFLILYSCSAEEEDTTPLPQVQQPTPEPEPVVSQFTLTVTAGEGGTVSTEGGTYDEGTEVTITATPAEGYEFVGWEGSSSTDNSLNITVNSNESLNAVFELIPLYTLTVLSSEGGTVSTAGGEYTEGTEIEIFATPNEGFSFTGWEGIEDTSSSVIVSVSSNATITALFEVIPQFTVIVSASEGGTVSTNGGTYLEGSEFSILATPNSGYEFLRWEEVDALTSSLTVTVSSNISLTAIFIEIPNNSNSSNSTNENLGPVFWRGSTITFNKSNGANPNLEENQDRIRENVWITRGNTGGQIFNIAINNRADKTESPVGTEWAIGTLDELESLTFDYFRNAISRPKTVVGKNLVLHLIEDDIYINVKFTSWSQGKRGGFSYERSTPLLPIQCPKSKSYLKISKPIL